MSNDFTDSRRKLKHINQPQRHNWKYHEFQVDRVCGGMRPRANKGNNNLINKAIKQQEVDIVLHNNLIKNNKTHQEPE